MRIVERTHNHVVDIRLIVEGAPFGAATLDEARELVATYLTAALEGRTDTMPLAVVDGFLKEKIV